MLLSHSGQLRDGMSELCDRGCMRLPEADSGDCCSARECWMHRQEQVAEKYGWQCQALLLNQKQRIKSVKIITWEVGSKYFNSNFLTFYTLHVSTTVTKTMRKN